MLINTVEVKGPVDTQRIHAPTHSQSLISYLIPPIEQIACPMAPHKSRLAISQ